VVAAKTAGRMGAERRPARVLAGKKLWVSADVGDHDGATIFTS